jgi:hypothetical protein
LVEQVAHNERLDRRREMLLRSFQHQERALNAIAIENIREGHRRELLRRRQEELTALEQLRGLIPGFDNGTVGLDRNLSPTT